VFFQKKKSFHGRIRSNDQNNKVMLSDSDIVAATMKSRGFLKHTALGTSN